MRIGFLYDHYMFDDSIMKIGDVMKRLLPILAVLLLALPCFSTDITVPLIDLTGSYADGQVRTATFDLGAGAGPVIGASLRLQGAIDVGLYTMLPDDGYIYFLNARWFFRYVDDGSLVFYSSDWDGPAEQTLNAAEADMSFMAAGPVQVEMQLMGDALVGMGEYVIDRWPEGELDTVELILTVDEEVARDDPTWGGMKALYR